MENELQDIVIETDNVVETIREYRRRHHEETKHMTREEFREHNRKKYEEAKAWFATIKPEPERFPFLPKK
jgi:hypothetical protein